MQLALRMSARVRASRRLREAGFTVRPRVAHLARAAASCTEPRPTRGGPRGSVRDASKLTRSVLLPGEDDLGLFPVFRPRLPEG